MTTRKPAPPADTVAADAHWQAKLAKLRARTRPTVTLTICDDDDLKKAAATARFLEQQAKDTAEKNPDDNAAQAAAAAAAEHLAAVQADLDQASVELRFQALPRSAFRELLDAHPPTEEQADKNYDHNPDTMAPVLIAAASLDPLTEEDAAQFLADWSPAEGERLYAAALRVQQADRMDLGKG
ncbi:hypothetical protein [Streptomyces anulatus]|uniref:hypothetical protein n=1 Tax=Streptomyces anulatus TaxID=1892 RepID=UPI003683D33B